MRSEQIKISVLLTLIILVVIQSNGTAKDNTLVRTKAGVDKVVQEKDALVFVDNGRKSSEDNSLRKPAYVPNKIVFKLAKSASMDDQDAVVTEQRIAKLKKRHKFQRIDRLFRGLRKGKLKNINTATIASDRLPIQVCRDLLADPDIEWAEPVYYRYVDYTYPNDEFFNFSRQACMYRINATSAWDITTGSNDVVIAIIDTGIDYGHVDLSGNMWTNTGETQGDGQDNDGNGYIDDFNGWDFVSVSSGSVYAGEDPGPPDNDPSDFFGHGTNVAGIAGAVGNNAIGIAGTCWDVSLMNLRAGYKNTSGKGVLETDAVAEALIYAVNNGADIINMSYGSEYPSHLEKETLDYCSDAGLILISSAGNDSVDKPHYPAAFNNVIAVGGVRYSNGSEARDSISNYGLWVDVSAHSSSVYSTESGGGYGYNYGTSFASPLIAGVAGLTKSVFPEMTADQVALRLRATAQDLNENNKLLVNKLGAGLVDAKRSITAVKLPVRLGVTGLWPVDTSDTVLDPGEMVNLAVSVKNFAVAQSGVSVSLATDDPYITVVDSESVVGDIGENRIATGSDDPFRVQIASNVPRDHFAVMNLTFSTDCQQDLITESYPLRLNDLLGPVTMLAPQTPTYDYVDATVSANRSIHKVTAMYQQNGFEGNYIWVRQRDAFGQWSSAVNISVSPIISARTHNAVTLDDGRVHAVFNGATDGDTDCEVFYVTQDPVTGVWSAPLQISVNGKLYDWDIIPSHDADNIIAADANGNPHIIWADYRSGSIQFYYKYYTGSAWSPESMIATPTDDLRERQIQFFFDHAGTGHLFWKQADLTLHTMKLSGGTWSAPQQLHSNISYFSVDVNSSNHLDMAYVKYETGEPVLYQQYNGSSWSTPLELTSGSQIFSLNLRTASDDSIHIVVENPTENNLFRIVYDGNSWSMPGPLVFDHLDHHWYDMDFELGVDDEYFIVSATETPPSTRNDVVYLTSQRAPSQFASRPVVVDSGQITKDPMQLTASWSSSHSSGIDEYQYAIGTVPGGNDHTDWTSTGTGISMTDNFSSTPLKPGQTYYISVKALNHFGLWSPIGSSNGIEYQCVDSDDFESTDFTIRPWVTDGHVNWTIATDQKNSGLYSAKSGSIGHSQYTSLEIKLQCVSGEITFYRKVSSQNTLDYLAFYIDGIEQGRWSGDQDWAQASFPVKPGARTFKWKYTKDASVSSGSDSAWIDDIVFPVDCDIQIPDDCTKYGGGEGTSNNPYRIFTAEQMNSIGESPEDWGKHFLLTEDIDVSGYPGPMYHMIGSDSDKVFTGTFDGGGHTISGFTFKVPGAIFADGVGLFEEMDSQNAVIRNLIVADPDIDVPEEYYVAAIVGQMGAGTIENCAVIGGQIHGETYVGGIAGSNNGMIIESYSTCEVSGKDQIGGLVGKNAETIQQCYSTGNVSGEYLAGGIAGRNSDAFGTVGLISDCYALGDVTVTTALGGGLVGQFWGGDIVNCYSAGIVSGPDDRVGGLIGETISGGASSNCFWDIDTSGQTGSSEGQAKTTEQMKTQTTFTSAGWDFDSGTGIWIMPFNSYPQFRWAAKPIDLNLFARFARYWLQTGCTDTEPCKEFDWFVDGVIDTRDLDLLAQSWLNYQVTVYDPVNFKEFAYLSEYWQMTGCSDAQPCSAADWYTDGNIDMNDLYQLAQSWFADKVQTVVVIPPEISDDFETGDFTAQNWVFSGNSIWAIVSDQVHQGSFAAKSGPITHNQTSSIEFTVDTTGFDKIKFARKVSSESSFDYLRFYIDGNLQEAFSGELDWLVVEYSVSPGVHTFKWQYYKDGSVSRGSDCVWIDGIRIYDSTQ